MKKLWYIYVYLYTYYIQNISIKVNYSTLQIMVRYLILRKQSDIVQLISHYLYITFAWVSIGFLHNSIIWNQK